MPETQLYFAYTSLLAPDRLARVSPGAQFLFTAHYPETRLAFVSNGNGSIPTLAQEVGHTVWGGVFAVPGDEVPAITAAEEAEGRVPGWEMKAVDREGNKHDCLTFVSAQTSISTGEPQSDYVNDIIRGARHWKLPAGWVVGLEDLLADPLFD